MRTPPGRDPEFLTIGTTSRGDETQVERALTQMCGHHVQCISDARPLHCTGTAPGQQEPGDPWLPTRVGWDAMVTVEVSTRRA